MLVVCYKSFIRLNRHIHRYHALIDIGVHGLRHGDQVLAWVEAALDSNLIKSVELLVSIAHLVEPHGVLLRVAIECTEVHGVLLHCVLRNEDFVELRRHILVGRKVGQWVRQFASLGNVVIEAASRSILALTCLRPVAASGRFIVRMNRSHRLLAEGARQRV